MLLLLITAYSLTDIFVFFVYLFKDIKNQVSGNYASPCSLSILCYCNVVNWCIFALCTLVLLSVFMLSDCLEPVSLK